MKEELLGIERYQGPKERSLAQAASNLEAMMTTKEGLEAELHQVGISHFPISYILYDEEKYQSKFAHI